MSFLSYIILFFYLNYYVSQIYSTNNWPSEFYFLGILYLGIICGNVVIVIALFNSKIQDPLYSTYSVILQVYTPFTVSIGPIFYRYIFKRSHLILDLEDSREYLIRTFEIEVSNPAEYYDGNLWQNIYELI